MDRFNKIWTMGLAGILTGLGLVVLLEVPSPALLNPSGLDVFFYAVLFVFAIGVALLIQIILHEAGHLIGGLLSGYRFASFRIFNLMIVKRDGKYLRKKFHIVGTGGQCLMAPPEPYRPDFPYRLYNLAGGLTNLIVAGLCILLLIPVLSVGEVSGSAWTLLLLMILIPMAVAGLFCGITNLVPMIIGGVPNDGWNLAHLGEDPEARRIFWLLLDVMAMVNRGGQIRDLPEEWFLPASESPPDYNNSFQFSLAIYRFNYLGDTGRLEEAAELARQLLREGKKGPALYRYELSCEAIFLELIGDRRRDVVEKLYTPELARYIKATDSYPQRQRLHYAMAMLYDYDEAAAALALERFKKACSTYPNDGEISSEWEMIGLVDCKLAEVKALEEQLEEQAKALAEQQEEE